MRLFRLPTARQTDETLMALAAKGSERAFEELYNRYARRLQGFFFRQTGGDQELAADLSHDTLLRAYAARDSYQPGRDVGTWLFTIAYNLLRNTYRRQARDTLFKNQLEAEPLATEAPDLELQRDMLDQALRSVLHSLPPDLRLLFSLRYEEELTVPQIARITALPEGTVKSRLHRTLQTVKQKLQPYESE